MAREIFYGDKNQLDLQKIRDSIEVTVKGDSRNPPEKATLHFHWHGAECNDRCEVHEPEPA